jgi:DNA-binding GntR family transcriptional regulator|tara:strand:+ start:150 stop:884 length:735 start_codon:yes stop_codon:yes gene_type:complete
MGKTGQSSQDDEKVTAVKLGETIASRLRDEIIAGEIAPNEQLRLMPLAERLGVSTTPVREALAILDRQGLVYSRLHRSFRVTEITSRDIADVYSLHSLISELLTERATRRLSAEDLDELVALDDGQQQATREGNAILAGDLNHELHRRIHLASDSSLLLRFLRETTPFVTRQRDPDVPGWAKQRTEGHGDILQAMRDSDGPLAGKLMGEHIRRSGQLASNFATEAARETDDSAKNPALASRILD